VQRVDVCSVGVLCVTVVDRAEKGRGLIRERRRKAGLCVGTLPFEQTVAPTAGWRLVEHDAELVQGLNMTDVSTLIAARQVPRAKLPPPANAGPAHFSVARQTELVAR
jgi:hypothetical protein